MRNSICIIPARGGSQRIPRKNIKNFHGKPIIAYSIQLALNSGLFNEVYVSTEDTEIAVIASKYGAKTIQREKKFARDRVGTQEVIKQTIKTLQEHTIYKPALIPSDNTIVCCLYATSPLLSEQDLKRGRDLLLSNRNMHYAFSIGDSPLQDAGNFYFGYAWSFTRDIPLYSPHTIMVPIQNYHDINTPEDWEIAERKYAALHRR